jgi:hypothetical protein
MSPQHAFPTRKHLPISSQNSVAVQTPAASPITGTLVSTINVFNQKQDVPSISAVQLSGGSYLAILEITVHGNVPEENKVPAMGILYCYDGEHGATSFKTTGVTCQGGINDGFTTSSSVLFSQSGQGPVVIGTVGGWYHQPLPVPPTWAYDATVTIYRQ